MRQGIYKWGIGVLLMLLFFSSCNIGEIVDKDEFASHQFVFDYSGSALYDMLFSLDMAAKVNAYAEANSDSARNVLKENYFSKQTIASTTSGWSVQDDSQIWTFVTNGSPLDSVGAVWNVSLADKSGKTVYIDSGGFIITAIGQKEWTLSLSNVESEITEWLKDQANYDDYFSFKANGSFHVSESVPNTVQPLYYNYKVESGNGGFIPNKVEVGHNNVHVAYSVEEPLSLEYNSSQYVFTEGNIHFDVLDESGAATESFDAKITSLPGDWTVTFNE